VISAHKLGGPVGIGALLVRDFAMLEPSGGQERGYRAGTENLPAALAFASALEAATFENWATTCEDRVDFLQSQIEQGGLLLAPKNCSHILSHSHPVLSAQAQLIRLDALGFAVSAGSACSSGSLKPSRVLRAFGIDEDTASRTIRVSLGWSTTAEELQAFAEAWKTLN
jgi:cysteine desulfurase